MANWKMFKITEKWTCDSHAKFHLDSYIDYADKMVNYIFLPCSEGSRFSANANYQVGDRLEINLDVVKFENSFSDITDWDKTAIRGKWSEFVGLTTLSSSFTNVVNDIYKDKCEKLERELRDLRNEKREKEEKLGKEIKELKEKLEEEQKDLQREKRERRDDKTKYDNEKLEWTKKEGEKNSKIARLEEKLRNDDAQKTELEKELADTKKDRDNQTGKLEIKLDQKSEIIRGLNNQLSNLRVSDERKDNEIRQKDEEIERLKRWAGLSREELLSERINLKYGKLEIFANQIGINLQQVSDLCRYCERLVQAQKNYNQANIETHENNITRVREGLRRNGVQIQDIQKFCRKCEKIAKMRFELNEIRRQQGQYEAQQELPPLHNNRIN